MNYQHKKTKVLITQQMWFKLSQSERRNYQCTAKQIPSKQNTSTSLNNVNNDGVLNTAILTSINNIDLGSGGSGFSGFGGGDGGGGGASGSW